MSYQVLARKWRPKSFAEVVGQSHVLKILSNALTLGRVHHAYLFSGTRGVGKTSIARLLAKGLNCETGITATPCGVCGNCQDIEQGRFVDLLEIDAASRTKVEDTREILDNIQYLPTRGRFKVYLIDEVHMLSRSSFNALLKTLEEPPEHVKFLLATTDPQKLPITILSRCLHLHLSVLDNTQIQEQLHKILTAEQIDSENRALQLLAKSANGSMRDALSLTDQAIALGNGKVDTSSVSAMLGTLDDNIPFALLEALLNADGNTLMTQLQQAAEQGADWDTLLADTIALLHQIAMLQFVSTALGEYQNHEQRIRHLAQAITPQDVQLYYQILLNGRKELNMLSDKKIGVEMAFLRAIAFQPKVFQEQVAQRQTAPVAQSTQSSVPPRASHIDSPKSGKAYSPQAIDVQQHTGQAADKPATSSESSQSSNVVPKPINNDAIPSLTQSILAAREQLISSEAKPKKPSVVAEQPTKSARLASIQQGNYQQPENRLSDSEESEEESAETYQWKAQTILDDAVNLVTPKNLRLSLEHEKTPELTQKLVKQAAETDIWAGEIEQLSLMPLIKQLAINGFIEEVSESAITLHLRTPLAHLNTKNNIQVLAQALTEHRQKPIELTVVIDDDKTTKTPLEWREELYQQRLKQAKETIHTDDKVSLLCQYFDAQIDEESIRPV